MLAAVYSERSDAEARRVGEGRGGGRENSGKRIDMAALDDAEAGAAEQHQDGCGEAEAARKIAFEQRDNAVRRLAFDGCFPGARTKAEILAQQHDRANGGRSQVSLGP